ncbi:hypothetical protein FQZ97_1016360 [compost metagenome]
MQIPVGHHRPATIPVTLADNMHRRHIKGVGVAHNCANIHIMLPVLNRNMKIDSTLIKIGFYSLDRPVAIFIFNITAISTL